MSTLALDEAIRRLNEQQTTLASIRSSAGTILSASTIGSAFLAGIAFDRVDDINFGVWTAIVLTALTAVAALSALWPAEIGVTTDQESFAQPEWTQLDNAQAALHLAAFFGERADTSTPRLNRRWWYLRGAILSTGLAILAWMATIAVAI